MDTYRLSWTPSTSTFVQVQKVFASVNGAPATQQGADLPSNVSFVDVAFPTDAQVDWHVQTVGDNNSLADSQHDLFTALNLETVQPATGLAHQWLSHQE